MPIELQKKRLNPVHFVRRELASAMSRGVRQLIVIGSGRRWFREAFPAPGEAGLRVFVVDENGTDCDTEATFIATQFGSESLAAALAKSDFDKWKSSLFVWLGGAGYKATDAVLASLAFIGSLPKDSGVLFDYVAARSASLESKAETALDALASRLFPGAGSEGAGILQLIDPQAVAAMLSVLGFRHVVDLAQQELFCVDDGHLVSAIV